MPIAVRPAVAGPLLAFLIGLTAPAVAAPLSEAASATLRPGGYLWSADAPAGPVTILIDRRRQRASVYRAGALIGLAAVSTGKPGHGTPAGEFTILEKDVHHRSNIYSNAPMPYMQRLTWGGVAIHAGHNPGFPASHGCIRVPLGFAKLLFAATQLGAIVRIGDGAGLRDWTTESIVAVPPHSATWLEQSADDYVSWGGTWRTVPAADGGTQ